MSSLNPDREMLARFAGLMFKHARPGCFVSAETKGVLIHVKILDGGTGSERKDVKQARADLHSGRGLAVLKPAVRPRRRSARPRR